MNKALAFFALLTGIAINSHAQRETITAISVCELLQNRLKYDGQMVEVRGLVEGSHEGAVLAAENCSGKIITEGFTWPNAIALVYDTSYDSPHVVDFVPDRNQIDRVDREASRIARKHPHAKIALTYVGLFETRTNLGRAPNFAGKLVPAGFGHGGACPAQLVIKTKKDLRVQSVK